MQMRPRYPLILGAAIVWMMFVLLVYYWIHKPLTVTFGRALGGALLDLASALVMTVIAAGAGRRVIEQFQPHWTTSLSRGERIAGEALLGLGLLGNLVLLVGVVSLSIFSMGGLLLLLAVVTRQAIWDWLKDFGMFGAALAGIRSWDRALVGFVGFNLMLGLITAFAPPSKFDSLTYHLVGPKHWLDEGRIVSLSGSHFFGFPQLINTLFAGQMALLLGRLTGAAVLHWVFGVLALIGIASYGKRRFSLRIGLLAIGILLTATSFWMEFSWPYVDLPPVGFAMVAYICLEQWRATQETAPRDALGWLILAGVAIGLSMSVKYPLVGIGVAGGLYVLVYSPRARIFQNGAILVGVATLVLAPWLIRNWAFYDNPIYPYGPLTGEWDQYHRAWYSSVGDSLLNTVSWMWFTAPLASTFLGVEGAGGYAATIGPLFLLLLPMLLITWRGIDADWKRYLKEMAVFGSGIVLTWLGMAAISEFGAQTRLWYAVFPMFAFGAAIALQSLRLLPEKPLNFHFVVSAMAVLVFVLATVDHVRGTPSTGNRIEGTTRLGHFLHSQTLDYLMGVIDEDDYLEHALGWHIVAMREINKLPDDSEVLFLWETRSLYCDEPRITCLEDSILVRWWQQRRTIGEGRAAEIVQQWRSDGVTHVLVRDDGRKSQFDDIARFTEADIAEWNNVPALLEVVWEGGDEFVLYAIPPARPER